MAGKAKAIPDGFRSVTPYMVVRGADQAIEFYKKAFGAEEVMRMPGPDGKSVAHAEIRIGDSVIMLGDEWPEMKHWLSPKALNGTSVGIHLYVADVDTAFQRAVSAGATVMMPLMDMFWGDRYGKLIDPFGHCWSLATHQKDVTPDELRKGQQAFFAEFAKKKHG